LCDAEPWYPTLQYPVRESTRHLRQIGYTVVQAHLPFDDGVHHTYHAVMWEARFPRGWGRGADGIYYLTKRAAERARQGRGLLSRRRPPTITGNLLANGKQRAGRLSPLHLPAGARCPRCGAIKTFRRRDGWACPPVDGRLPCAQDILAGRWVASRDWIPVNPVDLF
jgi:hypothetical protein